jgi:calcium-dependent protein kinase
VDCIEDDETFKVIMEYCRGGDLQAHVEKNGPLSEADLSVVAFQVLQMLKTCQTQGIVFADVKPSNFCILQSGGSVGMIKAIDFGCSRFEEGLTMTGTPAFMSPEVFTRRFSYKTDIWSLGMTLFWLYTLGFPYSANIKLLNMQDICEQVNAPFSKMEFFEKTISAQGFDFISMCLSRDQNKRLYAHEALNHPWIERALHKF